MKLVKLTAILTLAVLFSGCWDRLEVEDQLFPVTIAIDRGKQKRYHVMARVAVPANLRAGILGGQAGGEGTSDKIAAESDSITQALLVMNTGLTRRMTFRHVRGVVVSEELARDGLDDLFAELFRNGQFRQTAGFFLARGSAVELLSVSRPTAEFNPGKINEGLLLVEKSLHMAPPIRLHHMINRSGVIGVDPYAPLVAANRRIMGREAETGAPAASSYAGELDRMGANPLEVAGTAVFRDTSLAGFLTVDETQALLALRGEMGKAYITLPNPYQPEERLALRYQQENLPQHDAWFAADGPRIRVRLLFEGEVLSSQLDFSNEKIRIGLEKAAAEYFKTQTDSVLSKMRDWGTDPVGYGLLFRNKFPTWDAWRRFNWRKQIPRLRVDVEAKMRIRRYGLVTGVQPPLEE